MKPDVRARYIMAASNMFMTIDQFMQEHGIRPHPSMDEDDPECTAAGLNFGTGQDRFAFEWQLINHYTDDEGNEEDSRAILSVKTVDEDTEFAGVNFDLIWSSAKNTWISIFAPREGDDELDVARAHIEFAKSVGLSVGTPRNLTDSEARDMMGAIYIFGKENIRNWPGVVEDE